MNQVEAVRNVAERGLKTLDGGLDAIETEAGGAEERQHSRFRPRLDQLNGSDAVRHGAGRIGVTHAMVAEKLGIAQLFRKERGSNGVSGADDMF